MEKDREDLITAISKLRGSINELNHKGRERLVEAYEKVNKKFNDVYTKLFNGGTAKLELVFHTFFLCSNELLDTSPFIFPFIPQSA